MTSFLSVANTNKHLIKGVYSLQKLFLYQDSLNNVPFVVATLNLQNKVFVIIQRQIVF